MIDIKDAELANVIEDDNVEKPKKKEPSKRGNKKQPSDSLFSKVKKEPVTQIRTMISVTENAMQDRLAVWDRHKRKYRRGLRYLQHIDSGVPLYFTNYIYANVETVKSNITRNLPLLNCSPRGERDDLSADLLTRVLVDSFDRTGIKQVVREVVHNGLINTMGFFKTYFSEELDELVVECVPTEDLLVDPKATTLDNARFIIHKKHNVPLDEIFAEYGEVPEWQSNNDMERQDDKVSNYRDGLYITEGELQPAIDLSSTFDTYECWVRCWDADRENDWYIVTIAGDTILREEFSIYNHNKHPFSVWFAGEDFSADNIYYRGIGYIEEVEPLQDRVDAVDLKIYKSISLNSNRQRYINASSGLNIDAMDNTAGRTYKVNGDPSKAVYYDAPPQMAQQVYEYRDRTEMLIQTVSGVYDVTMGRRPTGITAGRAIESLKDSAETRIATLVDTLADTYCAVGDLGLQIILQFYDGERLIKATDADKDADFVVIDDYPSMLQPQPTYLTDEMGMPVFDEAGEPVQENPDEEPGVTPELVEQRKTWREQNGIALVLSDVSYSWDVKANTDSALPSARAERGQIASDLFRLGAIDREALLESLDYPGRHKILQRLAKEATGKNAGEPMVDQTSGQMEQLMAMLQQSGVDPGVLEQIMAQLGQTTQGQQTGNFQPQMTM